MKFTSLVLSWTTLGSVVTSLNAGMESLAMQYNTQKSKGNDIIMRPSQT